MRSSLPRAVIGAVDDPDPLVVVGAAWFLAERHSQPAVPVLAATATGHDDARCREAAVAALGAIGDPAGLAAVLGALRDSPTVRRRATVALAGFDDPRVMPRSVRRPKTGTGRSARQPANCSTSQRAPGRLTVSGAAVTRWS